MNKKEPSTPSRFAGIYYPEMLSRRGEITVWVLFVVIFSGWVILSLSGRPLPIAVILLGLFTLMAGMAISLGNWMDRRTFIRVTQEGVQFENGLRKSDLRWEEITHLEVYPSKWGSKVHVRGHNSHFSYRTLGEVKLNQEIKGRMGFNDGDKILQVILERSHLKKVERSDAGDYYVR